MPKAIKAKTKIPTPLGLILLIIALFLGIFLNFYQDAKNEEKRTFLFPKNTSAINLTDKSATITWTTDLEVKGEVVLNQEGKEKLFVDDRDKLNPKKRSTHFVALDNLAPQTRYTFKIRSDGEEFFNEKTQFFQTAPFLEGQNPETHLKPLVGAVIDETFEPVEGGLVYLDLPGASKIGTFSNSQGNFILPMNFLLTEDLKGFYNIEQNTNASLVISKNNKSSIVEFTLPLKNSSFETLTLGRNINLREYLSLSEEVEKNTLQQSQNKPAQEISYDLNKDGKINSVDLSIVVQNFGKRFDNKQMDFNSDGLVDQKDIELFISSVPNTTP
jgi:hypothetical protein